ncbi:MAG: hypothetical protein Q8M94_02250 [Ignavibacteria bacterium]|nr:hypothetical protein [Ignavibacteria bacterium]
MKAKYIISAIAIIALIINVTLFYIPNIRGDFSLIYTPDERLQMNFKDGDYIEIFWGHDYWRSIDNEYSPLVRGTPETEINYKVNSFTGLNEEIHEIVENPDIKIETKLVKISSQDFKLRRKYEIKNPLLMEDLDISFIQLIIGSNNYSYEKENNILNLAQCHLIINKPNEINLDFNYKDNLLMVSQVIHRDIRKDGTYIINLNFSIDCEKE